MTTAQIGVSCPMFEFTEEHGVLRSVLREYFSSTVDLDPQARWQRLVSEVGVDEILLGPPNDETAGTAVELAILAEESGSALFGGPVLSTAALAPLAGHDGWDSLIDRVRAGDRGMCAAVSLTTLGDVQPAVEPLWDFAENAFVIADRSIDGERVIVAFDGEAAGLSELGGLDLSRSLGALGSDAVPPLQVCSGTTALDTVNTVRQRCDLMFSAELLGVAQRVLDGTVEYVSQRVQFGRTIGSFQAVKHRLADMLAQVELTRSAVYGAAWQLGDGPVTLQTDIDLATAAVLARDAAVDLTKGAVQLHGGIAITWEHWAHRYLRRAHAVVALTGSAARHRRRLAALVDTRDGAP